MTFTTNTETLQSGTMAIQFYLPPLLFPFSSTVYIKSVSSLKYEFEVPSSTESPNAIGTKPGTIKVTLMQRFRGTELIDAFETIGVNDKYLAIMSFTEVNSDISGDKYFYYDKSSLEYDEIEQLLEIELTPVPLVYISQSNDGTIINATIDDYLNGNYNSDLSVLPDIYIDDDRKKAVLVGQFIRNALELITKSSNIVYSSETFELEYQSSGAHFMITDDDIGNISSLEIMFGIIASVEGSIYGSFFGESFYVERGKKNDSITTTLTYNVVKNITRERFNIAEYRDINITLGANTVSSIFNDFAEKTLNISFQIGKLIYANTNAPASFTPIIFPSDTIQTEGIVNYSKSLGLTNRITAEIELLGFGLKPYSRVRFDSDAPAIFQGKTFAISKIEYDFVNYTLKANIYEIAFI